MKSSRSGGVLYSMPRYLTAGVWVEAASDDSVHPEVTDLLMILSQLLLNLFLSQFTELCT